MADSSWGGSGEYLWNADAPGRQWLAPKLNPAKDGGWKGPTANEIKAAVTKDQWLSYLNEMGAPQEQMLMKFATDPNVVTNAMAEASADSSAAFGRAEVNNDRMLRSLGLTLNADEKKASDRSFALSRSIADVQSQEMARRGTVSLQQSVLGSPAPRIGG